MGTILIEIKRIFNELDDVYFKYLEDKPKGYHDDITLTLAMGISNLSDVIYYMEKENDRINGTQRLDMFLASSLYSTGDNK